MEFTAAIIKRIETRQVGVAPFFATLLAVVTTRNFLENILEASHGIALNLRFYHQISDLCHIYLAWGTVFLSLILLLRLFSGSDILGVAKSVLTLFPIIILVPVLDFFVFGSGTIAYQQDFETFRFSYGHLFDPRAEISYVTDGVRVEIFLATLFAFIYIHNATHAIVRSIAGALCIYSSVFFYGYLPAIYNKLFAASSKSTLNGSILFSNSPAQLNFLFYLPIFMVLCCLSFCFLRHAIRRVIVVSVRINRLAIYLSLMFFGVAVAAANSFVLENLFNLYDFLKLAAAAVSLSCAFVFSAIVNDISDCEIDRISNPDRPLAQKSIKLKTFSDIKAVMLFLALFFAVPLNEYFVLVLIFILSLSYLYSREPFRLKKLFPLGHGTLALIGMSTFLLGSCLVDGILAFSNADNRLLSLIFVFFFIASHLKDIKDDEGDRRYKIPTLTTLVGKRKSYIMVSLLISIAIVASGCLLQLNAMLIFINLVLFALACMVLKNSERLLVALQFSIAAILSGYLFKLI